MIRKEKIFWIFLCAALWQKYEYAVEGGPEKVTPTGRDSKMRTVKYHFKQKAANTRLANYMRDDTLASLANIQSNKLKFDKAKSNLDKAIKNNEEKANKKSPNSKSERNPALYHQRGVIHRKLGQLDEAISDFREAAKLNPKDHTNKVWLVDALVDAGKYNDAVEEIKDFNVEELEVLGQKLSSLHQEDNAHICFDMAVRLKPEDAIRYKNRAQFFMENGHLDKTVDDYRVALSLSQNDHKNNEEIRFLLAEALFITNRTAVALQTMRALDDEFSYSSLGDRLAAKNRFEDAILCYTEAIEAKGSSRAEVYEARGACRAKLGYSNMAIGDFEQAIILSPHSPEYKVGLAEVFLQAKKYDDAEEGQIRDSIDDPTGELKSRKEKVLQELERIRGPKEEEMVVPDPENCGAEAQKTESVDVRMNITPDQVAVA